MQGRDSRNGQPKVRVAAGRPYPGPRRAFRTRTPLPELDGCKAMSTPHSSRAYLALTDVGDNLRAARHAEPPTQAPPWRTTMQKLTTTLPLRADGERLQRLPGSFGIEREEWFVEARRSEDAVIVSLTARRPRRTVENLVRSAARSAAGSRTSTAPCSVRRS